nr:DMT family transporter [Streptomyces sp. SID8379]
MLAFAGVTLVVLGRGGGGAASWQGDALAVTAAALWGWYPVVTRPLLTGHSALRITAWTSTVGAAVLLPLAALTSFTVRGTAPDALSWFSLAYSVLLVTVAGLVLWYRAVRRAGSAAVMLWMFAVPPAAALFAAAVGADSLTWPQAAGTAVILAALGYVHAPARPSTRTHERALHDHHPRPGGHDRAGRARLRP